MQIMKATYSLQPEQDLYEQGYVSTVLKLIARNVVSYYTSSKSHSGGKICHKYFYK